jgi:hypothetical protein
MPNISPQNWPQQNWPGSWPPSCSCGCNPCQCGGGWGGLMQCWQDIAQFQQFLMCMLSQMGPYPVQGVTDGSDAKAGNIGEYVIMTSTMAYAAYPTETVQIISAGVLSPGDWNITCSLSPSTVVGSAEINLSPTPAGMSNAMSGFSWVSGASTTQLVVLNAQAARGSFSVPTLLPFRCVVSQAGTSTLPAGTATLQVEARRMR